MSKKRKDRPYLRSVTLIGDEGSKSKFRLIKVSDEGVRQCTLDYVSTKSLPDAIRSFVK
jgi:hypothetical protein